MKFRSAWKGPGRGVLLSLLTVGAALSLARPEENECVRCHRQTTQEEASSSHSFSEWQKSVHARNGVTCDACHGGDPAAKDKPSAHRDLQTSSDPESRLYFNRLPVACGGCHARELEAFKSSAHYQELQNSGKGPNCATCHGSMATRVMAPKDMDAVCTLCHRSPTQAYATLMTLESSRNLLNQLQSRLREGAQRKVPLSAQAAVLEEGRKSYSQILQVWHSFDTRKVLSLTQELNQKLRNALHEVELKSKNKSGPSKP